MRAGILLLAALFVAVPVQGVEVSPITVRVEQTSGNASSGFRHTQRKALKVYVSNTATSDSPGLRVKFFYFGKSLKAGDTTILQQGERKADVKTHATVTVETPEIESVYTEEHGQPVDRKGGRGAPRGNYLGHQKIVRYKTVEATGRKVTGYGVQVFSGNLLVAEAFSEPSLKALVK
jgi:hypothetical protein